MLRKAFTAAIVLSGSLLTPMATTLAAGQFFAEDPPEVAGSPFSAAASTESVTTFADGNRIVRGNKIQYYRDGKGRTRIERGEGPNRVIAINDPVSGMHYLLRPQTKSLVAYKTPPGQQAPPPSTPQDDDLAQFALLGLHMAIGAGPATEAATDTTSLGEKSISGVSATGTRIVRTIPGGVLGNEKPIVSTLERWVSADLGLPVQIHQTSTIGGDLTLNVASIVRSEPDPALFVPPADYAHRGAALPANPVTN